MFLSFLYVGDICAEGKLRLSENYKGAFENTCFCLFWQFLIFQESRASKSYAYAYVLLSWQLRDVRYRRNQKI